MQEDSNQEVELLGLARFSMASPEQNMSNATCMDLSYESAQNS
jgi:hypothetical protein